MFNQQANEIVAQIEKVRKLLDQLYSEDDALIDEEIRLFRSDVIYKLKQLEDKVLTIEEKVELKKFIRKLVAITEQQTRATALYPNQTYTTILNIGSNNYIGKEATNIMGAVTVYINPPDIHKIQNDEILFQNNLISIIQCLKAHYQKPEYRTITRVSGNSLSLDICYVNLSIIHHQIQQAKEKAALVQLQTDFNRLPSYETIYHTDYQNLIEYTKIFAERPQEDNFRKRFPMHVLILGRAGIGKTTLCKKIVHDYLNQKTTSDNALELGNGLWKNKIKWLLWIPLRNLKKVNIYPTNRGIPYNLGDIFYREYFLNHPNGKELARQLWEMIIDKPEAFCLLLDGKDEIISELRSDTSLISPVLNTLFRDLKQCYIITTSRPTLSSYEQEDLADLVLETIGFNKKNVHTYLQNIFKNDQNTFKEIIEFIYKNPIVSGFANVPILLDILCFSWSYIKTHIFRGQFISMTLLYQVMTEKLWLKYIDRSIIKDKLRKNSKYFRWLESAPKNAENTPSLKAEQTAEMIKLEQMFLKMLAFKGVQENKIEFTALDLATVTTILEKENPKIFELLDSDPYSLINDIKQSPFLTTQEDESNDTCSYYFLHLSEQEFLSACYLIDKMNSSSKQIASIDVSYDITEFISNNKYNPRYENIWIFYAGLNKEKHDILASFFKILLASPFEIIGFKHQEMMMRYLDEADIINSSLNYKESLYNEIVISLKALVANNNLYSFLKQLIYSLRLSSNLTRTKYIINFFRDIIKNGNITSYLNIIDILGELINIHSDIAIPFLLQFLCHQELLIRKKAASYLGQSISEQRRIIEALIKAILDEEKFIGTFDNINVTAANAISQLALTDPDSALDCLIVSLKKPLNYPCKWAVAKALGQCAGAGSKEAVTELLKMASSNGAELQMVIESLGSASVGSIDEILNLLTKIIKENSHPYSQHLSSTASQSIQRITEAKPVEAFPILVNIYNRSTETPFVKGAIIQSIAKAAKTGLIEAVEKLQALIQNEADDFIRSQAVRSLAQIASTSKEVRKLLIKLADNENLSISINAIQSLEQIIKDEPEAMSKLLAILKSNNDFRVRASAAYSLREAVAENGQVLCCFKDVLSTEVNSYLRQQIIKSLSPAASKSKEVIDLLKKSAINDLDTNVSSEAINSLRLASFHKLEAVQVLQEISIQYIGKEFEAAAKETLEIAKLNLNELVKMIKNLKGLGIPMTTVKFLERTTNENPKYTAFTLIKDIECESKKINKRFEEILFDEVIKNSINKNYNLIVNVMIKSIPISTLFELFSRDINSKNLILTIIFKCMIENISLYQDGEKVFYYSNCQLEELIISNKIIADLFKIKSEILGIMNSTNSSYLNIDNPGENNSIEKDSSKTNYSEFRSIGYKV